MRQTMLIFKTKMINSKAGWKMNKNLAIKKNSQFEFSMPVLLLIAITIGVVASILLVEINDSIKHKHENINKTKIVYQQKVQE